MAPSLLGTKHRMRDHAIYKLSADVKNRRKSGFQSNAHLRFPAMAQKQGIQYSNMYQPVRKT